MLGPVLLAVAAFLPPPSLPKPPSMPSRPVPSYVRMSPPTTMFDAAQPMVLFMNRNGGTFTCPSDQRSDDASHNVSSIACGAPSGTATVTPFRGSDDNWQTVFSCIQNLFSPFNLTVTDVQPTSGQYIEAVIGGSPDQAGQPGGVAGVAPFSCAVEPGAIVYDFADVWGGDLESICETAGQETAHAFGLDHEFLCEDPMTYLTNCGDKAFQDEYVPCGEFEPRECTCGTPTQNSVQSMYQLFGSADGSYVPPVDHAPPTVEVTSPADGAILPSTDPVVVTAIATDDTGFSDLELDYGFDDQHMVCPAGSNTSGDYTCARSGDTVTWTIKPGVGMRTFHVHAVDIGGHVVDTAQESVWLSPDGNGPPPDAAPPFVAVDAPLPGGTVPTGTQFQIVATMMDDTGIALAELNWQRRGNDNWIPCDPSGASSGFGPPITCTKSGSTYTWTLQQRREGDRTLQVRATDLVGNVTTTDVQTITLKAGVELPVLDENASLEKAKPLACGDSVTLPGTSTDWFHVDAQSGSQVTVSVEGDGIVIATNGKSAIGQATPSSTAKLEKGKDPLDLAVVPSAAGAGGATVTVTCVAPKAKPEHPAPLGGCGATGAPSLLALAGLAALLRRRRC